MTSGGSGAGPIAQEDRSSLRRAGALRCQCRSAGAVRAGTGSVGRVPPGGLEAQRAEHRQRLHRGGRAGAAAVVAAAAASGPGHGVERLHRRAVHRRDAVAAAAAAQSRRTRPAAGRRDRAQRCGHRPLHHRAVRARPARRADDGAARAHRAVHQAGAHRDRGHRAVGRLRARRVGGGGHGGVRAGDRTAGAVLPASVRVRRSVTSGRSYGRRRRRCRSSRWPWCRCRRR